MSRPSFLIVNPTSGSFSPGKLADLQRQLAAVGLHPHLMPTTKAEDATLFAEKICADEQDPLLLVAGGDGTLNGVLNGLVSGRATLAVLPTGTSNVLARELKIGSLKESVLRIARGESRPVSVGEVESAAGTRRFFLMAGVGVDGAVVAGVRLKEKKRFGKGAYLAAALRHLVSWDPGMLEVVADGRSITCHSVIVCNACRYGGNFRLAPEAGLFAPGFQLLCMQGGPLTYLKLALFLLAGTAAANRSVTAVSALEIEIKGDKPLQVDGDPWSQAPARIRALPDFVRLIV